MCHPPLRHFHDDESTHRHRRGGRRATPRRDRQVPPRRRARRRRQVGLADLDPPVDVQRCAVGRWRSCFSRARAPTTIARLAALVYFLSLSSQPIRSSFGFEPPTPHTPPRLAGWAGRKGAPAPLLSGERAPPPPGRGLASPRRCLPRDSSRFPSGGSSPSSPARARAAPRTPVRSPPTLPHSARRLSLNGGGGRSCLAPRPPSPLLTRRVHARFAVVPRSFGERGPPSSSPYPRVTVAPPHRRARETEGPEGRDRKELCRRSASRPRLDPVVRFDRRSRAPIASRSRSRARALSLARSRACECAHHPRVTRHTRRVSGTPTCRLRPSARSSLSASLPSTTTRGGGGGGGASAYATPPPRAP